ncbi:MAG: CusA/CzcA family heavy metal efflux RND transporter [Bacteroidales bacterium]|nr:CusA/CzcA family heavy metal efflux RND transporter [Bacteroidales bacterium]MCF8387566.1 CusA/CzcA family heavy metal efflux RND transporter [Bacteroidales bacterium]MCF8399152.1 CusA/CzcA family heavy metal efflux RND transporter [Bacteroidales bacterium]
MINKLVKFSLYNRLIILAATLLVLGSGIYILRELDIDIFPDLNAPTVVIMTEAHGMATEEVERLVSFPVETAINGANNMRRVRSSSSMGFSIVWAEFEWGTDIYEARQTITERLATVNESLPDNVDKPVLAPQTSLLGEILIFSITSDSLGEMELRTLADWDIRTSLLSVPGIAQVTIIGGEPKQYQILANPQKMKYYDVSLQELLSASENINNNSSGSFIEEHTNRYLVRGIARTSDKRAIGNNVVKVHNGHPVLIRDIAKIEEASSPIIGKGSYEGRSAVVITVNKQPDVNTLKLTERINQVIVELENKLPARVHIHQNIFEQADFINVAVENVQKALIEGAVLVVIILFIFLMNVRTTFISVLAIPLSLLVSVISLKLMGLTINTMSLGGMAIAIGAIVDDAIIDVENVYKRLKENVRKPTAGRRKWLPVIYDASVEIRASILNATFIILVAFIPLFFLGGMEGRMLKPLGIAFIVSLFASLIVAVTLTPVLCSYLLTNESTLLNQKQDNRFVRTIKDNYEKALQGALRYRKSILSGTIALFVFAIILLVSFGRTFLPPFNEGSLAINVATYPGVAIDESDRIGKEAEEILLEIPEVITTSRKTGRAELAEHSFGANVSEIEVPFELKDRSREDFLEDVRNRLNKIPGVIIEVGQPITHRIDHMLSGTRSNIAIKLFGNDLRKMYTLAKNIEGHIESTPGVVDLFVEQQVETPQIQIRPKRELLARFGIPVHEFNTLVSAGLGGLKVSDVFEEEKKFDLIVRFQESYRDDIESLRQIMIDAGNGQKIPLQQVAEIESASGPYSISREDVQRKIVISANVSGRDLRSVVNDIRSAVDENVELPEGFYMEYGGQFESESSASRTLLLTSIGAIILIFLILYQEFKNTKVAAIILLNLPLALIGGVFAIWITSGVISIPSIIGFITLFGIATRNGILLVSRYLSIHDETKTAKEVIIKGSLDRINPILMTALSAALALIPLAVNGDLPGNEIQSPMAIVILGGLLTATVFNLFIIPIVFYSRIRKEQSNEN